MRGQAKAFSIFSFKYPGGNQLPPGLIKPGEENKITKETKVMQEKVIYTKRIAYELHSKYPFDYLKIQQLIELLSIQYLPF